MARPPGKRVLTWAAVLLLWGIQLLGTGDWYFQQDQEDDQREVTLYFPPTMEFAQHTFNQEHKDDEYAYRVEHILNVRREQTEDMVFFMTLQLRRTKCKKFQDDLDNCPFQESLRPSNIITCAFSVSTLPWTTEFHLLKKNCSEGPS